MPKKPKQPARPAAVAVVLDEITTAAVRLAQAQRWTVVAVAGEREILIMQGRPGRCLVIT
jgi:hypothetical protein